MMRAMCISYRLCGTTDQVAAEPGLETCHASINLLPPHEPMILGLKKMEQQMFGLLRSYCRAASVQSLVSKVACSKDGHDWFKVQLMQ